MRVLRWGRSAYETDASLALERSGVERIGGEYSVHTDRTMVPELGEVDLLVVTSGVRVGRDEVSRLPSGAAVVTTTSGYDHIDVDACVTRGVAVHRMPLARRDAVVEHALAEMIVHQRRLGAMHAAARAGHWARGELPALAPRMLGESRVAVIGLGVIGSRMAEVLGHLGAEVVGVDPRGGPATVSVASLDQALAEAHVVTLHCALTASSRGMLCDQRLRRLRPGCVVVNTARGAVLDVEAAVEGVRQGRLGGLSVDVFPEEPWPGLASAAAVEGVRLTPHGSGYTVGLGRRVAAGVVAAAEALVRDEPLPHGVSASRSR